jgi:hypothetical protein
MQLRPIAIAKCALPVPLPPINTALALLDEESTVGEIAHIGHQTP